MDFGITEALTYFKDDKNWKKKFLIGYVFLFLYYFVYCFFAESADKIKQVSEINTPAALYYFTHYFPFQVLAFFVATLLALCFISGYIVKNTNLQIFKPGPLLCEWKNLNSILFTALKQLYASCIYGIVAALPLFFSVITFIFMVTVRKSILECFICFGFVLLSLLFLIAVIVYFVAADVMFCADLKFGSYFKFKAINKIFKENRKQMVAFWLVLILISIASSFAAAFSELFHLDIILLPLTTFYCMLVTSKVKANFARYVFKIDSNEN